MGGAGASLLCNYPRIIVTLRSFRALQGTIDDQTAEIMLTSLSCSCKAVIPSDAPFLLSRLRLK